MKRMIPVLCIVLLLLTISYLLPATSTAPKNTLLNAERSPSPTPIQHSAVFTTSPINTPHVTLSPIKTFLPTNNPTPTPQPTSTSQSEMNMRTQWVNALAFSNDTRQVILVTTEGGTKARISLHKKTEAGFVSSYPVFIGCVGKNGLSKSKVEGDKKSPSGIYPIGLSFGRGTKPADVLFPYRQTKPQQDYWVSHVTSDDYNTWVTYAGNPNERWGVGQYEDLYALYELAFVIEYNTSPIVSGKGSAIFFHSKKELTYTAGCTAVSSSDMRTILSWLNPSDHPVIVQGTTEMLRQWTNP